MRSLSVLTVMMTRMQMGQDLPEMMVRVELPWLQGIASASGGTSRQRQSSCSRYLVAGLTAPRLTVQYCMQLAINKARVSTIGRLPDSPKACPFL